MALFGRKPHQAPLVGMLGTAAWANLKHIAFGLARIDDVLILTPRAQPTGTVAEGTVYYDATLKKLRCYDGTAWQNCW